MMLTKSDFLLYLECPLHLWAKKHDLIQNTTPSDFDQFTMRQGQQAEKIAIQYLSDRFLDVGMKGASYQSQPTFTDGGFRARVDAVIINHDLNKAALYEVKSPTKVKKEHLYDVTFQFLVANATTPISHMYLVHLNPEYIYDVSYDMSKLFLIDDVTDQCRKLAAEVDELRTTALAQINQFTPDGIAHCYSPKKCPCPELCHPQLSPQSIYTLRNISHQKADELLAMDVTTIRAIPAGFNLSHFQHKQTQAIQENKALINLPAIQASLAKLTYPLYFLDYETCISALPLYTGYHPQQQMVFQYSLHAMTEAGQLTHSEYLADRRGDPAGELVKHLRSQIGDRGSVIVWNKSFEGGRHVELAGMYPEYSNFLLDLNHRMYDLADVFKHGDYLDPKFEGSWSIKKVLPVLVPELGYQDLIIGEGGLAMLTWWEMISAGESISQDAMSDIKQNLLQYCQRDTQAMVEIWKYLKRLTG
ncbi:MAG: DUF2779 domain-containing protein [Patescibacteria group bacterium]